MKLEPNPGDRQRDEQTSGNVTEYPGHCSERSARERISVMSKGAVPKMRTVAIRALKDITLREQKR